MRIGSGLLILWLIIGAIAAGSAGIYNGTIGSCTKASTVVVTILAGPLNYVGVNPKIDCKVRSPVSEDAPRRASWRGTPARTRGVHSTPARQASMGG